jgi:hypothetical protein
VTSGGDSLEALEPRCSSRPSGAATSTCTTSATRVEGRADRGRDRATAQDLRSPTHVRHLRASCRHLNLRPLAVHGRQPDHDRPALRPPRTRRTRACDPSSRRAECGRTSTVDAGGRCVDAGAYVRRQRRQREHQLSRRKLEALWRTRTADPSLPFLCPPTVSESGNARRYPVASSLSNRGGPPPSWSVLMGWDVGCAALEDGLRLHQTFLLFPLFTVRRVAPRRSCHAVAGGWGVEGRGAAG